MNYINICEYKSRYAVMTTAKKEDENFDCPEFLENNIYVFSHELESLNDHVHGKCGQQSRAKTHLSKYVSEM